MSSGQPPEASGQRQPPALPNEPATQPAGWADLLHNRAILAGLGVIVVLLLIAVVLVAFDSGDDVDGRPLATRTEETPEETSELPPGSLRGEVMRTVTIRTGPSFEYSPLGLVPSGATVAVIGRNEDTSWLQINYPPGSRLRGWLLASFVDVEGDVERLAIAGPVLQPAIPTPTPGQVIDPPVIILPTEPPEPTSTPPPPATPTPAAATNTPVATPTPQPSPAPQLTPSGDGDRFPPGRGRQ